MKFHEWVLLLCKNDAEFVFNHTPFQLFRAYHCYMVDLYPTKAFVTFIYYTL